MHIGCCLLLSHLAQTYLSVLLLSRSEVVLVNVDSCSDDGLVVLVI